jgi:hypothetical protein
MGTTVELSETEVEESMVAGELEETAALVVEAFQAEALTVEGADVQEAERLDGVVVGSVREARQEEVATATADEQEMVKQEQAKVEAAVEAALEGS